MQNDNVKFKILEWSTWPYWARGGILGFSFGVVLWAMPLINVHLNLFDFTAENQWLFLSMSPVCFFAEGGENQAFCWLFIGHITNAVIFSIAGVIIGWLYGKIKNISNNF